MTAPNGPPALRRIIRKDSLMASRMNDFFMESKDRRGSCEEVPDIRHASELFAAFEKSLEPARAPSAKPMHQSEGEIRRRCPLASHEFAAAPDIIEHISGQNHVIRITLDFP